MERLERMDEESSDYEKLKKEFYEFRKGIGEIIDKIMIGQKLEFYHYLAREIKNECDVQTLLDYLYENKIIDQKEFLEFRKKSKLFQSFKDENNNIYKIAEYFSSLKNSANVESIQNPAEFVSASNLAIQRERFLYKKEKMLGRGFSEESEEIKGLNAQIKEFDELMSAPKDLHKRMIKEEEYFLKKEEAEKMYNSFLAKKDEIIDRMRQLPLINDRIHLEAENKSLYYETISNFWFGNFNASICMLSIFIESFLKEIWFYKKKEHYEAELENLINDCHSQGFIGDQEKKYLQELREFIRNNYVHSNLHKIIPEVVVPAYMISLKGEHPPKPTYLTAENLPALRSIMKPDIDKEKARKLIIEAVKLVEKITTRNYDFQHKKESSDSQKTQP